MWAWKANEGVTASGHLTVTPRPGSQEQHLICTNLAPCWAAVAVILPSAVPSPLSLPSPTDFIRHKRMALFQSSFPHPCAQPQSWHWDTGLSSWFCFIFLTDSLRSAIHTHIDTTEILFSHTPAAQNFHIVCHEEKKTKFWQRGWEWSLQQNPFLYFSTATSLWQTGKGRFFSISFCRWSWNTSQPETVSVTKSEKKLRNHLA